ncbi:10356_t:CDS:2 [Gigaspora margarita]|uniref:10356_t:CDS:1 n=1 Tax=Gigaspora margarita TaxID=4874 RepID=A0ABN7UW81_GIGMA|nr:10356_t:CDS:2 [Gigaspora margarita]
MNQKSIENPHILKLDITISGFVSHITSNFIILEVTDIDFMISNINIIQDAQLRIISNISKCCSDIDIIAKDTDLNIL